MPVMQEKDRPRRKHQLPPLESVPPPKLQSEAEVSAEKRERFEQANLLVRAELAKRETLFNAAEELLFDLVQRGGRMEEITSPEWQILLEAFGDTNDVRMNYARVHGVAQAKARTPGPTAFNAVVEREKEVRSAWEKRKPALEAELARIDQEIKQGELELIEASQATDNAVADRNTLINGAPKPEAVAYSDAMAVLTARFSYIPQLAIELSWRKALRDIPGNLAGNTDRVNHLRARKLAGDLGLPGPDRTGHVDDGAWSKYCDQREREIPALQKQYDQLRAEFDANAQELRFAHSRYWRD